MDVAFYERLDGHAGNTSLIRLRLLSELTGCEILGKAEFMNPSRGELHQELRQRILNLSGVAEWQNAGIHEDAFCVERTMLMHIQGHGHCDIRLSKGDQKQFLRKAKHVRTAGRRKQDTSRSLWTMNRIWSQQRI